MEYVTDTPIDPSEMYDKIQKRTAGSVVLHYAVVRGDTDGQVTTSMHFERAGDMEAELAAIADGLRESLTRGVATDRWIILESNGGARLGFSQFLRCRLSEEKSESQSFRLRKTEIRHP